MRLRGPFGLLAVLAAAAAPATAGASSGLHVTHVDASAFPRVTVDVQTPAHGQTPRFAVVENGQRVPGRALQVEDPLKGASVALVLDASRSMAGAPMTAAVHAARGFAAAKRAQDRIGIYAFGDRAQTVQSPTTDGAELSGALDQVGVSQRQGTALYDGVVEASHDLARESGRRSLILLTDGADNASKATLAAAESAARDAGVSVFAIVLHSEQTRQAPVKRLAQATGGQLFRSASEKGVSAIYAQIAEELRSRYQVTWTSTASRGPVSLRVSAARLGATTARFHAAGAAIVQAHAQSTIGRLVTSLGNVGVALAVGIFAILAFLILTRTQPEVKLKKRIEAYTTRPEKARSERASSRAAFAELFASTERLLGHLAYWKRMAFILEQADLALRPVELFYLQGIVGLILGLIGFLIAGPILFLVFLLVGAFAPLSFVKQKASRRRRRFERQLPDTLLAMAASLRAGHSFAQAVTTMVKEGDGPSAKEFARVENETRLGLPMDAALAAMADRLGSKNFEFVVVAVNIQRQVGGSLAEILDMVADTVRSREQFARKVKALTAMGRASAYVLIAMPFFLAAVLTLLNAEYETKLFTSTVGQFMVVVGMISISIGTLVLRKMVNFRY